jgi:hypothetical protein
MSYLNVRCILKQQNEETSDNWLLIKYEKPNKDIFRKSDEFIAKIKSVDFFKENKGLNLIATGH